MIPHSTSKVQFIARLLFVLIVPAAAGAEKESWPPPQYGETIGHGDGRIHVIPSLSQPSVKNGEKVTVCAVIKARAGVKSVIADMGGIERITLKPAASCLGGAGLHGKVSMWSAEWKAHGLEEKYYVVALNVMDNLGHEFEDRSLVFSDPIAGLNVPGTAGYPNAFQKLGSLSLTGNESQLASCVIDGLNGYAYFGSASAPGNIIKINLGAGDSPPSRVAVLALEPNEDYLPCAVIDAAAGYAYFGIEGAPGGVVKVRLGIGNEPPVRVARLTFNTGENYPSCAVIDPAAGYAYFGAATSPSQVIKVSLGSGNAAPAHAGTLMLDPGENLVKSAVIDAAAGYAYFGTANPGKIVKVGLGMGNAMPSRIGALPLGADEDVLVAAVIDAAAGYAYFIPDVLPAKIVKVSLGAGNALPTRVTALTLNAQDGFLNTGVIDNLGYAYFGTNTRKVVKIALGIGNAAPTRAAALDLNTNEDDVRTSVIDAASGYAYFGTEADSGKVIKVSLGSGNAAPVRIGALIVNSGEDNLGSALIDPSAGYAYFSVDSGATASSAIIKVRLEPGGTAPTRVGVLPLDAGEFAARTAAVIDTSSGYAYFGTSTHPGMVVKVKLGSGDAAPTRVASLMLDPGEDFVGTAVIDSTAGFAYFGASAQIVKVKLGVGDAAPTRVAALPLNSGEGSVCAFIDTAAGYAYFGTNTSPAKLIKVKLEPGNLAPTRVATLTLNAGEDQMSTAVVDTKAGYAYLSTPTQPTSKIVKVSLGAGDASPAHTAAFTLNPDEYVTSAVIDTEAGFAYYGTIAPLRIVAVRLGTGNSAPSRATSLMLDSLGAPTAVIDVAAGCTYFGTGDTPGQIVKVRNYASQSGIVKASRFSIPEDATLTDVRFYSHSAAGQLRLAIYNNAQPRQLLWESAAIANTAANGELAVPISTGNPSILSLSPGSYWAAWQTASSGSVASYTPGTYGDGFNFLQPFGSYPHTLGSEFISSERWTEYVTYFRKPRFFLSGSTTQTAGATQSITITAKDAKNNIVTEYTGNQTLTFSGANISANPATSPTANGTVFGIPTAVNFTNGVASVPMTLYKAEAASIAVFDPAYNASIASPLNVAVSPAAQHHFFLSGLVSPQNAGQSQDVTLTAQDAYGNTRTAYTGMHAVTFSGANLSAAPVSAPTAGGINFGAPVSGSFTAGVAVISAMTLYKAENAVIDVTDGTINTSPKLSIVVNPHSISKFSLTGSTAQVAGTTQTIGISAQDTYGNIATSYGGSQLLLFSGANAAANGNMPNVAGVTLGGVVPLNFIAGQTQAALTLYKVEPAAIQASSGGFVTPLPLNVGVAAGPSSSLVLAGNSSQSRAAPMTLGVTAFDGFGNIETGYTGTVAFSSSDTLAQMPVNYTFKASDLGTKSFAITFNTAGTQSVMASDGSLSKNLSVNVAKSTPVITWSNPADINTLTPLGAAQLNALADVNGTYVYTPGAGSFLNVGVSKVLSVTFTPSDTTNYVSASANVNINVFKGTPSVDWPVPLDISYPTALSGVQLNATPSVAGTRVYTPPSGTVLNAGNGQLLSVQFTPADTTNYNTPTAANVSINVAKGTPVVEWSTPGSIIAGTPLSSVQLNAVPNVPGKIIYSPAAGSILAAADGQPLTATFTPIDVANYNSEIVKTVFINVLPPGGGNPPTASDHAYSVDENSMLSVALNGLMENSFDPNSLPLTASLYADSGPQNGQAVVNLNGSFAYTPKPFFSGTDSFKYQLSNGALLSAPRTVTITVNFVNQTPSFAVPANAQAIRADAGAQNVAGFATSISKGAPNEDGQSLSFIVVSISNAALFATPPSLAVNGTLSYIPEPNAAGQATVSVKLKDGGGTANGGHDTSTEQSFIITINPAPPSFHDSLTASGMAGAPFSYGLNATGGRPLTFSLTSQLPPGLALNGDTIVGTPSIEGTFNATVTASNGVAPDAPKQLKIVIVKKLIISTAAGTSPGAANGDKGPATAAVLNQPLSVARDSLGNIYVADSLNKRVRKIDPAGVITTVAGGGSQAGDEIDATLAQLNGLSAVVCDGAGNLFICETNANRVRRVVVGTGLISTYVAAGALASPSGMALDSAGNLFIADTGNRCVRKVDSNGVMTICAGKGSVAGAAADGGLATDAQLGTPFGVATDSAGNLFIADQADQVIRMVSTAGIITTFAGTFGTSGFSGDGGPATKALLNNPLAVAVDAVGNVYIADSSNNRVREVLDDGTMVTVAGAPGSGGLLGDGAPAVGAKLNGPSGVAVAGTDGSILIADRSNGRIRRLSPPSTPSFSSAPTATLNPTNYKSPVMFAAAVKSSSPVSWVWDFGDNTDISTASSPTHVFPEPKIYTVLATATDQTGLSVSATVQVDATVLGTDVPVEIMKELTLDPYDPGQSPLGPDEAARVHDAGVIKITSLKLNYKLKGKGKDILALTTSTFLKPPSSPNGQRLVLDLGGIVKVFTLSVKGSGKSFTGSNGNSNDKLTASVTSGNLNIKAQFKNGQFVGILEKIKGFGLNDTQTPQVDFNMLYDGQLYQKLNMQVPFKINTKSGTGSGKSQ